MSLTCVWVCQCLCVSLCVCLSAGEQIISAPPHVGWAIIWLILSNVILALDEINNTMNTSIFLRHVIGHTPALAVLSRY